MLRPDRLDEAIRVAVVADTSSAARDITRVLQDSGYACRAFPLSSPSTYDRVRELRPAVVVLRTGPADLSPAAAFSRVSAHRGPALVVLTPSASEESLHLARESGAVCHLVEPVAGQALAAAVWLSVARAQDLQQLNHQLVELRESFESRKAVERAKAILMRRLDLTEAEAHRRLQKESRNRNRRLVDTAWHVIKADVELSRSRAPAAAEAQA